MTYWIVNECIEDSGILKNNELWIEAHTRKEASKKYFSELNHQIISASISLIPAEEWHKLNDRKCK